MAKETARVELMQRWIWTPSGMTPYRAHPLMPDVGGVFVSAEDCKGLEAERDRLRVWLNEPVILSEWQHLQADRDHWRTWAGEAKAALEYALLTPMEDFDLKDWRAEANAILATYPTDSDSEAGGKAFQS